MPTDPTFDNMPAKYARVFEQITINNDTGHPQNVLRWLERRGYIEAVGPHYAVPIPVHMRWCDWCSTVVSDDEP